MEVKTPWAEGAARPRDAAATAAVLAGAAGTLLLGLWPTGVLDWFARSLAAAL